MTHSDVFARDAVALLGPRGYTMDAELMQPWLTDWRGRYTGRARGMASPATREEVAAFVALCARHQVAIVPQGGNSSMSGGATPDSTGKAVVLSLRRMATIRRLDRADRQVVCEAGVVLQSLHEAAAVEGLRFPLTLGGKGSATVGGLIATNAGGTQVLRHGTMRAQVLGLEVVLPDGRILDTLAPLRKDNRGFDVKQLFVGSEGTLGIVTAATLQLAPAIRERRVLWAGLPSIAAARTLLLECQARAGAHLEGFEVMPAHCLASVLAYLPDARTPLAGEHAWHALVELVTEGDDGADLDLLAEHILGDALAAETIADATIAASESQAEALWALRDAVAPAERAIGPAMQHDISVPVAAMADFIAAAVPAVEIRFPGTRAVGFGHLGDGNIHFHVLAPRGAERGAWEAGEGAAITRFVHDLVADARGSISAEHGIGQMKCDELARLGDPVALDLMRAVKAALDPAGLLNPGKLVPLAPGAATP